MIRTPKTVLVQTYHPYTELTHVHPLGIMSLAASARAHGHGNQHILDMKVEGWSVEDAVDALVELNPDVIGLSAMTYEAGCMHEVAREVKRRLPDVLIVCGGPHPSVAADDVMADAAVDFVIRGEGEQTFCELLDGVMNGRKDFTGCEGLHWRDAEGEVHMELDRAAPKHLDELPHPAWDLIDHEKYRAIPRGGVIYAHREFATMFSSRACPWRCTYCHNSYGKVFRERSAENVLEEIDLLVNEYGVKELVFMDDIFNLRPERAKGIARGIIERGYDLKLTFPNGFRGDVISGNSTIRLRSKSIAMHPLRPITKSWRQSSHSEGDEEAPKDRQGPQDRRLHRRTRDPRPRRLHVGIPLRDRGRDGVDDQVGLLQLLPHRRLLPRHPLQGHRALRRGRARWI